MSELLGLIYFLSALALAIYGFNILLTAWLYWRVRDRRIATPPLTDQPRVTVQLPIYNELYVVERLIDAAAALDWQRERLQIQVLDDSDDETTAKARARVEHYRRCGFDIALIQRADRAG
ncbi:MAG: glycosyl transferase family 2, partial [Chloroflexota bacterium]